MLGDLLKRLRLEVEGHLQRRVGVSLQRLGLRQGLQRLLGLVWAQSAEALQGQVQCCWLQPVPGKLKCH